jgi:hypothetical protein
LGDGLLKVIALTSKLQKTQLNRLNRVRRKWEMDSLQQISDKKFVNENQQNIFLKKRIYTLMRKIQYKLCNKTCKNIQRDFQCLSTLWISQTLLSLCWRLSISHFLLGGTQLILIWVYGLSWNFQRYLFTISLLTPRIQ